MGTRRYVLSVDNDNEFRSRCENRLKITKNHDFSSKKKTHLVWCDDYIN